MSDITREEAIKILKDTLYDERTPNNYIQAVRMGREALENQASLQTELEKINTEFLAKCPNTNARAICMGIVNNHIKELKGENNG